MSPPENSESLELGFLHTFWFKKSGKQQKQVKEK